MFQARPGKAHEVNYARCIGMLRVFTHKLPTVQVHLRVIFEFEVGGDQLDENRRSIESVIGHRQIIFSEFKHLFSIADVARFDERRIVK